MKDIIDEVGTGLMDQSTVDTLVTFIFDLYAKSDERIKENNLIGKKQDDEGEDDDEDDQRDDAELIKEENRSEYDF
jgi:hypothetical protein